MDSAEEKNKRLQEAADWFEQKREGLRDQQVFDRWLRDSRNMEAWLSTCKANEGLQKVRGGVELIRELGLDESNSAPRKKEEKDPGGVMPSPGGIITRRTALTWVIAGAGFGAAGLCAYVANAREGAQTKVGEQRLINLPDGALLDLNTDSKAYWKINSSSRHIWLERGELALTAHKASKPFVVVEGGRPLVAISDGMLNLRRSGQVLNVTVLTGGAQIQNAGAPAARLTPGALVKANGRQTQLGHVTAQQLEKIALWKQRELSFDGETLAQAVAEFNRYLPNKIVVGDDELNSLRILATGNWRIDAPDEFLDSLSASFDLSVEREANGGYLIQKRLSGNSR